MKTLLLLAALVGLSPPASAQSTDWEPAGTALSHVTVRSLFSYGGALFAGTQFQGIYRSEDDGETWAQVLPSVLAVRIASPGPGVLLAATGTEGVYRSGDDGQTWAPSNEGLPEPPSLFVLDLAVSDSYALAGTSDGVYFSEDDGQSWDPTTIGVVGWDSEGLATDGDYAYVYAYASSPSTTGFYRSEDGGRVWTYPFSMNTGDIVTMAARGTTVLAGGLFSTFRSADRGDTFGSVSGLPANSGGFALAFGDGSTAYLGNIEGAFLSESDGVSWAPFSEGLPPGLPPHASQAIEALALHDGYLFAGLDDDGVWRRFVGTATAAGPGAPAAFALSEAAPNPFRDHARLTLDLAEAQAVRVEVVDALGRDVAVLHDGALAAGTHVFDLDGARLPAGLYLVRVTGEHFAATRRAVLLR